MENLTDRPTTTQPSLLSLNEHCLLELFDFLKMEDAMRLFESCIYLKSVANRTFRKYSEIRFGERTTEKGKEFICRFITHFGHHVLSLRIDQCWGPVDWKIVKECTNLKRLEIWRQTVFQIVPSQFTVDNLEVFTLRYCNFKFTSGIVRNTKALNIVHCSIENNALTSLFRNSPEIKSFICACPKFEFDFRLLEMISNVEKIRLQVDFQDIVELDPLLKLNRLTKLYLRCFGRNISSFLSGLAKKGIIQELELWFVDVDEHFFETLKSFDSLQLLVFCRCHSNYELTSLTVWPPNLKHLKLLGGDLTLDSFLSTVEQLKHLETIDLEGCHISEGELDNFIDVIKLSTDIMVEIDNSDRKQSLDVFLPWQLRSRRNLFMLKYLNNYLKGLRIFNRTDIVDSLQIKIHFPGIEEWC